MEMDDLEQLKSWMDTAQQHLPVLSKPQAVVLALWSFAIVLTQSCGLTTVTVFLAELLQCKEEAMRQRLRKWYQDEADKKGEKRRELDALSELDITRCLGTGRSRSCSLAYLRRGFIAILAALIAGRKLPQGRFLPEPWPSSLPVNDTSRKTYPYEGLERGPFAVKSLNQRHPIALSTLICPPIWCTMDVWTSWVRLSNRR
jgi:hypothetical protein